MKKHEFIKVLRQKLTGYPESVVNNATSYYSELIDDAVEDNQDEEAVIASLGSIDDIVTTILKEVPLRRLVADKMKPKHRLEGWEIVLIILGFPIWFPILISLISAFFGIFIGIGSFIIGMWAGEVALLATGAAITFAIPILNLASEPIVNFALYMGGGLIVLGLGLVLIVPMYYLTGAAVKLAKAILIGIKRILIRKGE